MIMIAADLAFMFLLAVIWGISGVRIGRLASSSTKARLQSRARRNLRLIVAGFAFMLGKVVTVSLLGSTGWLFVKDTLVEHLVLLAFPIAAVLALSVPRLRQIARSSSGEPKQTPQEPDLSAASDPLLILPVQSAGYGAALDFVHALFFPARSLAEWSTVLMLTIYAVILCALWAIRRRRRLSFRVHAAGIAIAIVGVISWFLWSTQASALPDRISMADGMGGMSGMNHAAHTGGKTVSVTDLTGPRTGVPDKKFTLVAEKQTVRLPSGASVDAWTFNGQLPGPELRVKQGDLVEIALTNKDIENGVTLHWHGLDVPNGEDGVSGVTQDAVMPGQTYTYRFRAEQAGTFWYHSHQNSSEEVAKGLFGALIVDPKSSSQSGGVDIVAIRHKWAAADGSSADLLSSLDRRTVAPGTPVRFRLINAGNWPNQFFLSGVPYKVAAIDGTDLNAPSDIGNATLELAAGGRYDLTFIMPDTPVLLSTDLQSGGILLSADGKGAAPPVVKGPAFDPLSYGTPTSTPFGPDSHFDRDYVMVLDNKLGFYDGSFERLFTINGDVFPNTPTFMVKQGDLVKTTFVNRSLVDHPMHLHGHHMLVLSRDGKPVTGSPWWTDTLNVKPGEVFEVAFRADNPGIWMDHCHNLEHAAIGMTLHLAYEGVTTPFEIGRATNNKPE